MYRSATEKRDWLKTEQFLRSCSPYRLTRSINENYRGVSSGSEAGYIGLMIERR